MAPKTRLITRIKMRIRNNIGAEIHTIIFFTQKHIYDITTVRFFLKSTDPNPPPARSNGKLTMRNSPLFDIKETASKEIEIVKTPKKSGTNRFPNLDSNIQAFSFTKLLHLHIIGIEIITHITQ
jgi:hypothetical protein